MAESTQHKLDRIRPPRVQITYDVETLGAIEKKELPFIVGILSDLSGAVIEEPPKLKERKFVEIDRDNFNQVMKAIAPRLELSVDNKLSPSGGTLPVELNFSKIDDFTPPKIVEQVAQLRLLLEARQCLTDLLGKLDGNDDLDAALQGIIQKPEALKAIQAEISRDETIEPEVDTTEPEADTTEAEVDTTEAPDTASEGDESGG
ncbi:MAG: type VI secretion system contractile sheath small subunit [Deltaproteobacteria bacterium]|nr:type VI secretion system contractile sheath small subunit [Deltaproteobacteria bacterium]